MKFPIKEIIDFEDNAYLLSNVVMKRLSYLRRLYVERGDEKAMVAQESALSEAFNNVLLDRLPYYTPSEIDL